MHQHEKENHGSGKKLANHEGRTGDLWHGSPTKNIEDHKPRI